MNKVIVSTAYLGPVQYFSKLRWGGVCVEAWEHFQKQTYRNRARVMTAGGVRMLSVPVLWDHGQKMAIRDVRIDYSMPWQREHWRTLTAAYRAAPFFDHYAGALEPFFDAPAYRPERLFELNTDLTTTLLRLLGLPDEVMLTREYLSPAEAATQGIADFRDAISHKPRLQRPDPTFTAPRYYQVFEDRQPFAPNLSVVDLLFCEGPGAAELL